MEHDPSRIFSGLVLFQLEPVDAYHLIARTPLRGYIFR